MGKLDGRVAFITGAARGQGRSHAVRLAEEGADIIAVDICADIDTVPFSLASEEDLAETARLVRATGRRIVTNVADVRDYAALEKALDAGLAEFGRLDIVIANAGIVALRVVEPDPIAAFRDMIEVNLIGVWNTVRVCLPTLVDAGRGGSIVLTSSVAGIKGVGVDRQGGMEGYTASKHGVIGLMRVFAVQYGKYSIRVNSVLPTGAHTPMNDNDAMQAALDAHSGDVARTMPHLLPVSRVEASDITNAVLYFVSDDSRFVTGVALPVDAGGTV